MPRLASLLLLCTLGLLSAGCEQLGIESAGAAAARREADGKAVGGACRHAARAIEDCYALNRKVERAAVYAGWREMNEYMRENKVDPVTPQIAAESQVARKPADNADEDEEPVKSGAKSGDKPVAKAKKQAS